MKKAELRINILYIRYPVYAIEMIGLSCGQIPGQRFKFYELFNESKMVRQGRLELTLAHRLLRPTCIPAESLIPEIFLHSKRFESQAGRDGVCR